MTELFATERAFSTVEQLTRQLADSQQLVEELQHQRERLQDFIATASDAMWETDADWRAISRVQTQNPESSKNNSFEIFAGRTIAEVLTQSTISEEEKMAHLETIAARRPFRGFTFSLPGPNGKLIWLEGNGKPFFSKTGEFLGYRGTSKDVTQRKEDEARIVFMAHNDLLTSLPNRASLRQRIEEELIRIDREGSFAVLCMDLDQFKMVNDTLGHPAGDRLLQEVATRLRSCVRECDMVARQSGDEFTIVQTDLSRPEDADLLARRIMDAIGKPYDLDGYQMMEGVSIGIAIAPDDGRGFDQLLKNGDIALYRAKEEGRGTYRFFAPEMDARLQVRRKMENELRQALALGQFMLCYQPAFDAHSGKITCVEALLRWNHPQRGVVPPDEFIPLAEETGMIVPIGEWVLRQACEEATRWPEDVRVAVNLSSVQFRSRKLAVVVAEALAASGLPGRRLELEITESVLMQDTKENLDILHQLHGMGAWISMDDFGTGYSSLSYLRSFPFDKIKIDRSFVNDLSGKNGAIAIVRAIAGMGTSLGLTTTAEGVETAAQFGIVRDEGCTEVQGYLLCRPIPAPELTALFEKGGAGQTALPSVEIESR